jgi:hypothetical protein
MGLGLIFDNLCVALGVLVLWALKGSSYDIKREMRRVGEGGFGDNWPEALVGLLTFLIVGGLFWLLFHIINISSS